MSWRLARWSMSGESAGVALGLQESGGESGVRYERRELQKANGLQRRCRRWVNSAKFDGILGASNESQDVVRQDE